MVRIVLLGAGAAAERHARAFGALTDRAAIVGVHDDSPSAAAATAEAAGIPAIEHLHAATEDVDAAIVAGAIGQRGRLIGVALSRGLDVLCELPIAENDEHSRRLLAGVVRAPRRPVTMISSDRLYNPAVQALRELASGYTLVALDIEHHQPAAPGVNDDIVGAVMVHDLQLAAALDDAPIAATQAVGRRAYQDGPIDLAKALLTLEDGVTVSLAASSCGATRVHRVTMTTLQAIITCDLDTGIVEASRTMAIDDDGHISTVTQRIDVQRRDALAAQADAFVTCVERRANAPLALGSALVSGEAARAIGQRIALIERRPGIGRATERRTVRRSPEPPEQPELRVV